MGWLKPGWLEKWNPDDEAFWKSTGSKVAWKNLWVSVPALHLSFITWMMWSAIVVNLNNIGFNFTIGQLFWLTALPGLSGATQRIPHSFLVSSFGGRTIHIWNVATMIIPCIWAGFAIMNPATSYKTFVIIALLSGFGGGNFASSMSNISSFFPTNKQGAALGINAGLGNLGVSTVQFIIPKIIWVGLFGTIAGGALVWRPGNFEKGSWVYTAGGAAKEVWLQNATFIWVVPLIVVLVAVLLLMNNLHAFSIPFKEQKKIFRLPHTWIMTWLYIMTFGSFIGFSAAFPLTIKLVYGALPDAPTGLALKYAFLGPLVGSLSRVVGGYLSDWWGGARITALSGLVMIGAAIGVTFFTHPTDMSSFPYFLVCFLLLFAGTGIGNASTFRQVAVIKQFTFQTRGIILGWTSAMAAYGAFIIPMVFKGSIERTGYPDFGLYLFVVYYIFSLLINWFFYQRKSAPEYGC